EAKIAKTSAQIESLQAQINDINESVDEDFGTDMSDDSSVNDSIAMLDRMMSRQQLHLRDLNNAMIRIKNGTYGYCFTTGQLISKKRLLAVPTTTKSLKAKENASSVSVKTERPKPRAYKPKNRD
ncbi:MAG: TraR/DksA C4-type zinc finger protein, partial [Bacteroidota bacterium]